jgi:hypothetical protein
MKPDASAMPFIRIALWIVLLVSAMLLPFLPGRYDPLASILSAFATAVSFGALLLVPIGVVWLAFPRGYVPAKVAVVASALVVCSAAVLTTAAGSVAAAAVLLAIGVPRPVHLWRDVGAAQADGGTLSRTVPVALILVPLLAVAARLVLVEPAAAWSRDRAIASSAEIIRDIERFRERTGVYPVAIGALWPDYHPGIIGVERYRYARSGDSYNLYFEHPSTDLSAREIVMYNPRGEQDFSSHASDLLRLSPEDIRRQRGYFASDDLRQAGWKRFLFD